MSDKFEQGKPLAKLHLGAAGIETAEKVSPELLKFVQAAW